jgi:hypothetical protein
MAHRRQNLFYYSSLVYKLPYNGLVEAEMCRRALLMTNDYLLLIMQFVGLNTTPHSDVGRRRMNLTHSSKWTNGHFPQEVAQATIGTLLLSRPPEFFHKLFPEALHKVYDFLPRKGKTTNCKVTQDYDQSKHINLLSISKLAISFDLQSHHQAILNHISVGILSDSVHIWDPSLQNKNIWHKNSSIYIY